MSVPGQGTSAMVESAQSPANDGEPRGRWPLWIAGAVLIAVGVMQGPGLILYGWLRQLSWPCWWILASLVLFIGLHGTRIQQVGRIAGAALLLVWCVMRRYDLPYLTDATFAQLGESPLGPMLIVLGGLLLITNLPDGRLWKMWTAAAGRVSRRRWAALAMCGATLWILEPVRSHELCMNAADFCAEHGYYTPAIALTELGRDTFPPLNGCGTCYRAELIELSSRIALLRAKRAGYREERRVAATRIEREPPSITASPWGADF